jgi:hypothetical protein
MGLKKQVKQRRAAKLINREYLQLTTVTTKLKPRNLDTQKDREAESKVVISNNTLGTNYTTHSMP